MKYIDIKNLCISFNKHRILNDVSLEINAGDRIGIIGKNGSGKTTLVETILGVNNAKVSGYIYYDEKIKNKIRAVFQEYHFDSILNLRDLYQLYCKIAGLIPNNNIDELFAKYDLSHLINKKFAKLSGGEKQKFKLLMCLELSPSLIILDELTTSLDFQWRKEVFKLLEEYLKQNQDCALIIVSHDYNELKKVANKYYLVANKQLTKIDRIEDFFDEK